MGCDIHAYFEGKVGNQWHFGKEWKMGRKYAIFSKMSDGHERGSETPISPCKGIPKDVSIVVKKIFDAYDGDYHSHSYLSSSELQVFKKWLQEIGAKEEYYELRDSYENLINLYNFDDYRLVFAFDN